jgi:RND superfamily putative drug exporter
VTGLEPTRGGSVTDSHLVRRARITVPRLGPAGLPTGRWSKWLVLLLWMGIIGVAGPLSGKLPGAMKNDQISYLPRDSQSTRVLELEKKFQDQNVSAAVISYEHAGGVTADDLARASRDAKALASFDGVIGEVGEPIPAPDGAELLVVVPMHSEDPNIGTRIAKIRELVTVDGADGASGLTVHVGGPAGVAADLYSVFDKIDGPLLAATAFVVVVVLVLTYRSPLLWLVPLVSAFVALTVAQAAVYLFAHYGGLAVNGLSQGILTVLTFGAGTDYALLLVARYREELRRHRNKRTAMAFAVRQAAPTIIASAATVIVSMLCLLFSTLNSDRALGPVTALGVFAAVCVMITLLPTLLVIAPRAIFWPRVPRYAEVADEGHGVWARLGGLVSRRYRPIWVATALLLLLLAALGLPGLKADGLSTADSFVSRPDSVLGQEAIGRHFPAGSGNPAIVIARAPAADSITTALKATPGVSGVSQPLTKDGYARFEVTLAAQPNSEQAYDIVRQMRTSLAAVPAAEAAVGGFDAVSVDVQAAAHHDRYVVIPVVFGVVLVILMALLRAGLAALLLTLTVVLSFGAALGTSWLVFHHAFGFAGTDVSYPLFSFIFLVALAIDYNIFLMTRAREESLRLGTRAGVTRALAVTGGVITSAGLVLAATFAVLAVLPLVSLVELGFTVAFGVLLDTFIVRSLLVPALVFHLGDAVWWPVGLNRRAAARRTHEAKHGAA